MTIIDYLKDQGRKVLEDTGITDASLDGFLLAQMKRSVVAKGNVFFEAGDFTLVAPADPEQGGELSAFSFRVPSIILVHPESLDLLQQDAEMPPQLLEVCLASCGNPDFDQDPSRPLPGTGPGRWVSVNDYAEASALCRAYIDENGLGGGNWAGGLIRNALTHLPEAHVSYNGRVWPGESYDPDATPVYEPSAPAALQR